MTRVLIVNDKPENEPERLASLRSYDVLDTAPEAAFDELTDPAAHICEAPIALISLIDENRLWFKSRVGLSCAEIARNLSFCACSIHQPDLFIVPDATQDVRFADNALVTSEPCIRFYAGAPLIAPDGYALGTLCVFDHVPREMSAEHQQALRLLSHQVMTQLELRRRLSELAQVQAERNEALAMLHREQVATERKGAEKERRKIFERITDAFVALDKNWRYTFVNTKAAEMFGRSSEDLIGNHIWTEFPEGVGQKFHLAYEKAMADQQPVFVEEYYPPYDRWFENRIYPSPEGLTIYFHDSTRRKKDEALLNGQKRVLELIATGAPLPETLTALVGVIETQSPEMLCTVLLLDADGVHLRHGAAPSLPVEYTRAIDGLAIGPSVGSCGTAAFGREPVIVEDIATDPLWEDYRSLALPVGLRSCWSTPIFDAQRHVLGTFAIYYRRPGRPTEQHLQLIDIATQTAAVAIGRERTQAALLQSESRHRRLVESNIIGVMIANTDGSIKEANDLFLRMVGYTRPDLEAGLVRWDMLTPPEWSDLDEYIIAQLESTGACPPVAKEYFHKDGHRVPILATVALLEGEPGDCICLIEDMTASKLAEDALKETEERFSTIFKAAPGSMMLFSLPDGKTVEVNDEFSRITGYTREEAMGKDTGEMGMWADPKARERFLELIEQDGGVSNFEADLKHKSGAIRNGLASGHLITIRDKKYLLGVFFDITERKQAERERDRLFESERYARQVTETMSAANLALTQDLVLNTVLDTLLDFLSQLIPFDSANVMLLEDDTRLVVRTARGYEGFTDPAKARAVKFDIRHNSVFSPILDGKQSLVIPDTRDLAGWERPAGGEHVISWLGVPLIAGGKLIGLYSMDKTTAGFFTEEHRQLAESLAGQAAVAIQNALLIEEVRQYAAELELRVFRRTAQLSAANKELESFSYSVSHDLRAPLRAVSGFAEIIARRHRASLNEEGQHYFDNIVKASGRMGNLIDDLLTYSRLGRSGVRSETVALAALIGEIGGYLQSRVEEVHGTFKIVDGLPAVRGDHTLLSQLFTNLLENGITYKRPNVPPQVEVAYQLEGENVIVTVSDNGIGIPEEYYEKIFDIFQRLHTDEEYPGTGIGLATVKKSVELLGGSIWVKSVVGKGSAFRVKLPRSDV